MTAVHNPSKSQKENAVEESSAAERQLAWYEQNSENFRGLNSQMWQIPIIGMTLTGGLWFGVSNVKDSPLFQAALLGLAAVGNVALIIVLFRLRFVMGGYMDWINENEEGAKINSEGTAWYQKNYIVRGTFQIVLGLAAIISIILVFSVLNTTVQSGSVSGVARYYDSYAEQLADEYEVADFNTAHPYLASTLPQNRKLSVLDIGSGVSRDASALTALGHDVTVSSPSKDLIKFKLSDVPRGTRLDVVSFPTLTDIGSPGPKYDLILMNGVWSHISPNNRKPLMDRLIDSVRPGGRIYMTFRVGPAISSRSVYETSIAEIRRLATGSGISLIELQPRNDLIGRRSIWWRSVVIQLEAKGR